MSQGEALLDNIGELVIQMQHGSSFEFFKQALFHPATVLESQKPNVTPENGWIVL